MSDITDPFENGKFQLKEDPIRLGDNLIPDEVMPFMVGKTWEQWCDEVIYDADKRMRKWLRLMGKNKTWRKSKMDRTYMFGELFELLYGRPYDASKGGDTKYAKKLGMTREELIAAHLKRDCGEWFETHQPCGFLEKDGRCRLGEARPDSCKGFPFTDRTKRLYSLYSFLSAVSVCPVAYEICERLKQLYGFGSYRKRRRSTEDSIEQAPGFSFVAGYTSWGFPYGVPEEPEEDHAPESDEELPF